jgi:hypothetical protein
MVKRLFVTVASTFAMLAGPILAAETAPPDARATTAATTAAPVDKVAKAKRKVKRICTDDPTVGTRVSKRICKDVEVVDEERYYAKEARQRMMEGGALPTIPGGN